MHLLPPRIAQEGFPLSTSNSLIALFSSNHSRQTLALSGVGLGLWFAWSWCLFFGMPGGTAFVSRESQLLSCQTLCFTTTAVALLCSLLAQRQRETSRLHHPYLRVALESCLFVAGNVCLYQGIFFDAEGSAEIVAYIGALLTGIGYMLLSQDMIRIFAHIPSPRIAPTLSLSLLVGVLCLVVYDLLDVIPALILVCAIPIASACLAATMEAHDPSSSKKIVERTSSTGRAQRSLRMFVVAPLLYAIALGYLRMSRSGSPNDPTTTSLLFFIGMTIAVLVVLFLVLSLTRHLRPTAYFRWANVLISIGLLITLPMPQGNLTVAIVISIAGWALLEIAVWASGPDIAARLQLSTEYVYTLCRIVIFAGVAIGLGLHLALASVPDYSVQMGTVFAIALIIAATFLFPQIDEVIGAPGVGATASTQSELSGQGSPAQSSMPLSKRSEARIPLDQACGEIANRFALTSRETDVLMLLAQGRNSKAISERLGLSENTAKTHIRHIYEKCRVHSHQELLDIIEDFRNPSV